MAYSVDFKVPIYRLFDRHLPNNGGDADIHTKPDRRTYLRVHWHLRTGRNDAGRECFWLHFASYLLEADGDGTELSVDLAPIFEFACQENLEFDSIDTSDPGWNAGGPARWSHAHGFGFHILGKYHSWLNFSPGTYSVDPQSMFSQPLVQTAGFTKFRIRIDGPGRDDRGNAVVDAELKFSVSLREKASGAKPLIWPSSRDAHRLFDIKPIGTRALSTPTRAAARTVKVSKSRQQAKPIPSGSAGKTTRKKVARPSP